MSLRHRTRLAVRRHNPNGLDPVAHNAAVRASKAPDARVSKQFHEAHEATATAAALAAQRMGLLIQELGLAAAELLRRREQIREYGRAAGVADDDTNHIINQAVKRALLNGGPPDWQSMRDQIDTAYIRKALSN